MAAMSPITPESPAAVEFLASPNHGERRGGRRPDALVLHYTGMAVSGEALAWLCNPAAQVSCHYFVWEDGRIVQLVPEGRRAWHAGQSFWQGESDLNSASIGIEIANPGHDAGLPAFPEAQIAAVISLCRDIAVRLAIPPERILAHSDIAPRRKRDPGEKFPWARLHREGIGHYVEPAPIGDTGAPAVEVETLQAMLARYGYEIPVSGIYCATTEAVVRAFQRHFRAERVDGIADLSTVTTLRELIAALPA
jgi:N-acetylmuramoyl-L-alanine amidase